MSGETQICNTCRHFDQEQPACLELVNAGAGAHTSWEPKTTGVAGFVPNLHYTEWHTQPKAEDECHFKNSRWAPREEDQGPDPL